MEIYIDNKSDFYDNDLKNSNLCITVKDNDNFYYYEYHIDDRSAKVRFNDNKYIEEATSFFHDINRNK